MKILNKSGILQLLLPLAFITLIYQCKEPDAIETPEKNWCEQNTSTKELLRITYNGKYIEYTEITGYALVGDYADIFGVGDTSSFHINMNMKTNQMAIWMTNWKPMTRLPINLQHDYMLRSGNMDESCYSLSPENHLSSKIKAHLENMFSPYTDLLLKDTVELEFEMTNLVPKVWYSPDTNYVIDNKRYYSYFHYWRYLGATDGGLKNFRHLKTITSDTNFKMIFTKKVWPTGESKYTNAAYINEFGIGEIYGSWKLDKDNLLLNFHHFGKEVTHVWNLPLANYMEDNLVEKLLRVEKENNILKLFYTKDSAFIFYANPSEYNDTILYK